MAVRSKIKKGDTIEVISGREADRGQRGEVIKVLPKEGRVGRAGPEHAQEAPTPGADAGSHDESRHH